MSSQTVTVFGASGRQGSAQVRALLAAGYAARAVSRHRELFAAPDLAAAEVVPADYADPASLVTACEGAHAVFFQPPQVERPDRILAFAAAVGTAAREAGVSRLVLNSTMWAPDAPCGQAMYDLVLAIEQAVEASGPPLVVLRPTVFMDNWLTAFAKPALVNEHVYRYPHRPDLRFSPISLDDVAKFMVAAVPREDLVGRRLRIAGPETLSPPDVAALLSDAMGTPIRFEYITPAAFGAYVYELMGEATGIPRDGYIAYFEDFYTFNNQAPQQPFLFDVASTLELLPVKLERFAYWAKRQDWTSLDEAVGSATR